MSDSSRFNLVSCFQKDHTCSVYLAEDTSNSDREVVLKSFYIDKCKEEGIDPYHELEIMKKCAISDSGTSLPVIHLVDFHRGQDVVWMALEYLEVGSLLDLLRIAKTLNEAQVACVIYQIILALEYLASLHIIHRDIKPSNFLMTQMGNVKLSDFGVAVETSSTLNEVMGTPYYMAPEVAASKEYNATCDIWSLGISAYELITGHHPFVSTHPLKVLSLLQSPDFTGIDLTTIEGSDNLKDFLRVCLTLDPAQRPPLAELKTHPFLKRAKFKSSLYPLIDLWKSTS